MPKQKKQKYYFNLLPQDPFFKTGLGRFLNWSLNVGRYIVIFTELIVIASFGSRFVLDRKVTDLNESIFQKEMIVQSQSEFEKEFRLAQSKIQNVSQLGQQSNLIEVFALLQKVVPDGVKLQKLSIGQNSLSGEGLAMSNAALNNFISNLQISTYFSNINVSRIESRDEKRAGFEIQFSSSYTLEKK